MAKRRTRGKEHKGHFQSKGIERPRKLNPRAMARKKHRITHVPSAVVVVDPRRKPRHATGTTKRELIAQARKETGRVNMRWKATKKYMVKLDRAAKATASSTSR